MSNNIYHISSYRMPNNTTGVACCDMPFTDVILMVLEDVYRPFKLVPITKVVADGRTLHQMVRQEHGFDIGEFLTIESRHTAVLVDGSCLIAPWPHLLMANAYIFLRVQEGK
jgi:hypothetical protein